MKWKFVASNVWCVMANAMNYNEHEQLNRNKWNTQRFRLRTYYTEIKKKKKSSNQMNSNDRQGQRQCNGTIIWYLLFSSTLGCSIVWLFNKHVLADCNDYHHSTKMVSEIIDSGYLPYWTYFVVCHIFFLSPPSWWLKQCAMSEFNSKHLPIRADWNLLSNQEVDFAQRSTQLTSTLYYYAVKFC